MWVMPEFIASKKTGIISSDYTLSIPDSFKFPVKSNDRSENTMHILLSRCEKGIRDSAVSGSDFYGLIEQIYPPSAVCNLSDIDADTQFTVGSALKLITDTQCSKYRDRFLALCALVQRAAYSDLVDMIPTNRSRRASGSGNSACQKATIHRCCWLLAARSPSPRRAGCKVTRT